MKYTDTQVVFRELPNEITLAINISGCPLRCEGCHSSYLRKDIGFELTIDELKELVNRNKGITAVCFMGGDASPATINELARWVTQYTELRVGWYSGRNELASEIELRNFHYIKLGSYVQALGGLDSPISNQHLYEIQSTREVDENGEAFYGFVDITHLLKKSI